MVPSQGGAAHCPGEVTPGFLTPLEGGQVLPAGRAPLPLLCGEWLGSEGVTLSNRHWPRLRPPTPALPFSVRLWAPELLNTRAFSCSPWINPHLCLCFQACLCVYGD